MTRVTSIAAVLERFRTGTCRRRPLTTAQLLGNFRRRDRRRSYFALIAKAERDEQRQAFARVRATR
jgi:hypothetical protein